jgi:hypothetical protein
MTKICFVRDRRLWFLVPVWNYENVTRCKRCHFSICCQIVTNLGSLESSWHWQTPDNDKNMFCPRPKVVVFAWLCKNVTHNTLPLFCRWLWETLHRLFPPAVLESLVVALPLVSQRLFLRAALTCCLSRFTLSAGAILTNRRHLCSFLT